jgi:endonuclease III
MVDYSTSKQLRADYILDRLEEYYPETPIPLDHQDAYTLLIAVLLSAQCTDERVNKITPELFKKAKTPKQMIKLSIEEIATIIRPCGLSPRKSKAIWELSQILINEHQGNVPASFEELEKLPGVGHKTASVVMAQAFGVPAFPVDTHIHRLAQNWKLTSGKNVEQTERDLKKLFQKKMEQTTFADHLLWTRVLHGPWLPRSCLSHLYNTFSQQKKSYYKKGLTMQNTIPKELQALVFWAIKILGKMFNSNMEMTFICKSNRCEKK